MLTQTNRLDVDGMVAVVVDVALLVLSGSQNRHVSAVDRSNRPNEGLWGPLEFRFRSCSLVDSVREFDIPTKKSGVDGVGHSPNTPAYRWLTKRNVQVLPHSTLVGAGSKKADCRKHLKHSSIKCGHHEIFRSQYANSPYYIALFRLRSFPRIFFF